MTINKEKEYFEKLNIQIENTKSDLSEAIASESEAARNWRLTKESDPDDTVYKTWCFYQKADQSVRFLRSLLEALTIEAKDHFYVIEYLYSDRHCWELLERKSPNKFTIRRMKAINRNSEYGENDWTFESDPNGEKIDINRRRNGIGWCNGKRRFCLSDKPDEYYNFSI